MLRVARFAHRFCASELCVAAARTLHYTIPNNAMALIRTLFWTAIFLGATFFFTVIFEHGPGNLAENARKEAEALQAMVGKKVEKRGDQSDGLTPPLN
jgi:hypothetical protein